MIARRLAASILASGLCAAPAIADTQVASVHVPGAQLVGEARFRYLIWDVFDAELHAPAGTWSPDAPFVLTLRYLRPITGAHIAESSVDEIRRQGFRDEAKLAEWSAQMERIFPDVEPDSRLTGLRDDNGHARFFRDGREIGAILDREFTNRFFLIWLGENAADAAFRQRLIGRAD